MDSALGLYVDAGIMGAGDGEDPPDVEVCPPPSYGSKGNWTKQAHEVCGPVRLLWTSLAEVRSTLSKDLMIRAWPTFKFHILRAPFQYIKSFVDSIVTEDHFNFLSLNRIAYVHCKHC